MEAFEPVPPGWTQSATHAFEFCCPVCRAASTAAQRVWINRRSPVFTEDHRRKWQEFYQCECGAAWWAWSSDRPPTDLKKPERPDLLDDLSDDDPSDDPSEEDGDRYEF